MPALEATAVNLSAVLGCITAVLLCVPLSLSQIKTDIFASGQELFFH